MAFEHSKEDFRVCPETNFRVDRKAEFLMIIYAVVAVLCLSLGGIAALMIGLHKTPGHAWSLLGNDVASSFEYYRWLNIHGFNMLIFWIVWFEMAAVYFVATALLNSKVFNIKLGYAGFALMLIGTVVIEILLFSANPTKPDNLVMFTAYYPLAAEPLFYLAYILFAVGVLLNGLNFFLTVYHAQKSGSYPYKTLPLVVYGVFVAVVIAVQAILNGAVVMVGSLLYSLGMIDGMDADWWKQVFWAFGHTAQYINISATAAVWYALIAVSTGAKPLNEKYSRFAFFSYLVFTVPVATHHLIVDPAYSMVYKMTNATVLALGLAVPSIIHAFVIPGALEKQVRLKHKDDEEVSGSLYGWMKKLDWDQPAIPAIIWSVALFGIGGILGSIQGTYQLNMITHNTLRIVAHFHLTVVAGTTVAFMGLAYYFIELIPRRKIMFGWMKKYQLHIYSLGLLILTTGMFIAGVQGYPRRTATTSSYEGNGIDLPGWDIGLWILGFGAILAVFGGILFVVNIVFSLFFGEKLEKEGDWNSPIPGQYEIEEHENGTKLEAPSTFTFGIFYVAIFMLFYIVTFLILSGGWDVGRL